MGEERPEVGETGAMRAPLDVPTKVWAGQLAGHGGLEVRVGGANVGVSSVLV